MQCEVSCERCRTFAYSGSGVALGAEPVRWIGEINLSKSGRSDLESYPS